MEAIVDGWFKPFVAMPYTNNLSYYSSPHLIRPLPPKAIPHIRPNLRCYKIVKYCSIVLLIKRDHPSYKVTFSLQKRGATVFLPKMYAEFPN